MPKRVTGAPAGNFAAAVGNRAVARVAASGADGRAAVLRASGRALGRRPRTRLLQRYRDRSEIFVNPEASDTAAMQRELERLRDLRDHHLDEVDPAHRGDLEYNVSHLPNHISERENSILADATTRLTFDGETLRATGSITGSWTARSGRRREPTRDFDYLPATQRLPRQGPIPEGIYWIDPRQMQNVAFQLRAPFSAWGSHRVTIHPFHTTNTYGRGGFFIHGGDRWGSAGCVDLGDGSASFASAMGRVPSGHKVKLTVRYAHAAVPSPTDPVDARRPPAVTVDPRLISPY